MNCLVLLSVTLPQKRTYISGGPPPPKKEKEKKKKLMTRAIICGNKKFGLFDFFLQINIQSSWRSQTAAL